MGNRMVLFPGKYSYYSVILIALIDIAWISIADLNFPLAQLLNPILTLTLLSLCAIATDRISYSSESSKAIFNRIGYLMQGMIFLQISWISLRVFNHISMTTNFAYSDNFLSEIDQYFGFRWESYFQFVQARSTLIAIMESCYSSLTALSFISFLLLMLQTDIRRARYFLETFLVTAIICTAIGMFFPAKAAVATYLGNLPTFANFSSPPGLYHIGHLEQLRGDAPFTLNLQSLPGLVTFPSFHTAAGIILAASFWRTGLFWIVALYSAVMIAATPVFGGHYFVDLIGGAIVALAVRHTFASLSFYEGLFRRKDAVTVGAEVGVAR